jgi:hypothetical protein
LGKREVYRQGAKVAKGREEEELRAIGKEDDEAASFLASSVSKSFVLPKYPSSYPDMMI